MNIMLALFLSLFMVCAMTLFWGIQKSRQLVQAVHKREILLMQAVMMEQARRKRIV